MLQDFVDWRHRGGNTRPIALKIPVVCQQLSRIHDFNTGRSGLPELALFENRRRNKWFGFHVGDSVPQKPRRNELYLHTKNARLAGPIPPAQRFDSTVI